MTPALYKLTPQERAIVFSRLEDLVDNELERFIESSERRWAQHGWPLAVRAWLSDWLILELVPVRRDVLAVVRELLAPRCLH